MGYQIVGRGPERWFGEVLTDAAWLELMAAAAKCRAALPQLSNLPHKGEVKVDEDTCMSLRIALEVALGSVLVDTPTLVEEGDALDLDTVHRVAYVLKHDDVHVRRVPRWRVGEDGRNVWQSDDIVGPE